MGSSLKVELAAILQAKPATEFIIVSVCDQPYLASHHFNSLVEVYKKEKRAIVVSKYDANAIGVPVLFGASVFDDLLKIEDQQGALKFVKRNLDQVAFSEFKNGEMDVDTEADVQKHLLG